MYAINRKIWIFILAVFLMSGCGTHQLKQAQDSYNEAARIEARISFEDSKPAGNLLEESSQALSNYYIALSLVNEAIGKYTKDLEQDRLYGTALMLKALCEWRIAAMDETADQSRPQKIIQDIDRLVKEKKIVLGTRDRVLLKALPGLHEHALGLQQSNPDNAGRFF